MQSQIDFESCFKALTGLKEDESPFPWQNELFENLYQGNVPQLCSIPTGLGKTMVIPIWLLALANGSKLPRRLVYVVNRRTIVDQATDLVNSINNTIKEAGANSNHKLSQIAKNLKQMDCLNDTEIILSISTLRGELADNKEWKKNPTKPAIIIGTVDMIGSKLLFSGYGDTRRTRPLHAGILGCDTLFIHDEAHLTPAFGKLLRSIKSFQANHTKQNNILQSIPDIQVMELSATPNISSSNGAIKLSDKDLSHPIVEKRMNAHKKLCFHEVEKEGKPLQEKIAELALKYKNEAKRVIVFVRNPEDAQKISRGIKKLLLESRIEDWNETNPDQSLSKGDKSSLKKEIETRVSTLTGQIRGHERDVLLTRKGMQPFLGKGIVDETIYFVATSAAEVGMDLHADHDVCDLSTLDSMIQRFGRVNRFGECDESVIDIVYDKETLSKKKKNVDLKESIRLARKRTLELLQNNINDASPEKITFLLQDDKVNDAFYPTAETLPLTDILLDLWAQTSLNHFPARPVPESWLHGMQEDYPHTFIAWRTEVNYLHNFTNKGISKWLSLHPIITKEKLQIPSHIITKSGTDNKSTLFKKFTEEKHTMPVVIMSVTGEVTTTTLGELIDKTTSYSLEYATIVFPTEIAGLNEAGFFDPKEKNEDIDISRRDFQRIIIQRKNDLWSYYSLNDNVREENLEWSRLSESASHIEKRLGLKCVLKLQYQMIDEFAENDDIEEKWIIMLKPIVKKDATHGTDYPTVKQHNDSVETVVENFCNSLYLQDTVKDAVKIAARHHDEGKRNPLWQIAAGHDPSRQKEPLAKGVVDWRKLGGYRHEAGSLLDISLNNEIVKHPEKDLIMHLIGAHHGWARPHFDPCAFPLETDSTMVDETAYQIMRRYSKLQERFGWWKLAFLESILRQADAIASADEWAMEEEI